MSLFERFDNFLKADGFTILICLLAGSLVLSIGLSSVILVILYIIPILLLIRNKKAIIKRIDVLYILFFFIQAISFFWSENKIEYLNEIEKSLVFVFIPILFIYLRSNNVKLKLNSVIISYLISLMIFILALISNSLFDIISNNRPLIEFFSINVRFNLVKLSIISFHTPYLGMFLIFGIVLLLYIRDECLIPQWIIYVGIVLFILVLYLISNVTSYINLFLVSCVILTFKLKRKTLLIFATSVILLASILFLIFFKDIQTALIYDPAKGYWETPSYRILRLLHEGDSTRRETWNSAYLIIKENFWVGVGVGDFTDILQTLRDKNSFAYVNRLNSHNQFLSVFGTTGFFGLLIFIFMIINNLLVAIKNNSLVFYSFIIITFSAFLTENILSRQWGLIFFSLFNYLIYEHINYFKGKTA